MLIFTGVVRADVPQIEEVMQTMVMAVDNILGMVDCDCDTDFCVDQT